MNKDKGFEILDVLSTIAQKHKASVAQVALGVDLSKDAVTSVIIGARSVAQLDDNLQSLSVVWTPSR